MRRIIRLYVQHAAEWDAEFRRVGDRFAGRMHCRNGCSMCCTHVFSISALEAAVLAEAIARLPEEQQAWLTRAARDYLQEAAQRDLLAGAGGEASMTPRAGVRLACPALRDDACVLYEARPLICRKWGIPVYDPSKPDRLHACELNFQSGEEIDADDLVASQTTLLERWRALTQQAGDELSVPRRRVSVAEAILGGAVGERHNR